MQRQQRIETWLHSLYPEQEFTLAIASSDASFRRYLRARFATGEVRIIMDAPPEHENCQPWLHAHNLFQAAGVHVPQVFAHDLTQGFLLLEDLGDTTYLSALNERNCDELYRAALAALLRIQTCQRQAGSTQALPDYDHALLWRELMLFPDWYLTRHLGATLTEPQRASLLTIFEKILAVNLAEPTVTVHRDYHARNLMLCKTAPPGVIDFQDAVQGPITYDLASLLKDAYVTWPEAQTLDWLVRYWQQARKAGLPVRADFGDFFRDYEWMGVQRQLKVLGIFARLAYRDGKRAYLDDMPRVLAYLTAAAARYRELAPLARLLDDLQERQTLVSYTF